MIAKLRLIFCNPRRYVPLAFRYLLSLPQRMLSRLFAHTGFFMQEQMDINPKSSWYDRSFARATGGFFIPGDTVARRIRNLEPWDLARRDMLVLLLRSLIVRRVPGDLAELGVYRGMTARLIHHYVPDRMLHLFDTFEGFAETDVAAERERTGIIESRAHYGDTSVERVLRRINRLNENVTIHKGVFHGTFTDDLRNTRFAFVHLDIDLYEPTLAGLEVFYGRVPPGGFIVVHDYNAWPGSRKAVDEFFRDKPEIPIPMPDKNGSALIVKLQPLKLP